LKQLFSLYFQGVLELGTATVLIKLLQTTAIHALCRPIERQGQ
jgi:hypothetical protein